MLARAVIDTRGLEEKSIGRIQQLWENIHRGEIVREVDVCKCRDEETCSNEQGKEDSCAQEAVAFARCTCLLAGKSSLAAGAQNWSDLGHRDILNHEGAKYTKEKVRGMKKKKENRWFIYYYWLLLLVLNKGTL
jgi:hypothetical protein